MQAGSPGSFVTPFPVDVSLLGAFVGISLSCCSDPVALGGQYLGPWGRLTLQNLQHNAKSPNHRLQKTRKMTQVWCLPALSPVQIVPHAEYLLGDSARLCLLAGWHAQPGEEADSPSVGVEDDVHLQSKNRTRRGETAQDPPSAADISPDLEQAEGQDKADDGDAEHSVREDAMLNPLPASPGGLAPADLLEHENPATGDSDLTARSVRPLISDASLHGVIIVHNNPPISVESASALPAGAEPPCCNAQEMLLR